MEKAEREDPSADLQVWAPALIKACSDKVHAPWISVYESNSELAAREKRFIISKCSILYLLLHLYIWPLSDSPPVSLRFASALFSFFLFFFGGDAGNEMLLLTWKGHSFEKTNKLLKWCWAAESGGVRWECFRNFTMSRNSVENPFLFKWKRRVLWYDEVFSLYRNAFSGKRSCGADGGAWISSGVVMLCERPHMIITLPFLLFL